MPLEAERCSSFGPHRESASRFISSPRILPSAKRADFNLTPAGAEVIVRRFTIDELSDWIDVRFGPSSGPGGQNVNKVSTRATVLLDIEACTLLTPTERARLRSRCARRLSRDGRLRVSSQAERTQVANRAIAEERLLEVLERALYVAPKRRATRPTAGSKARRLEGKRQRGATKRLRGSGPSMED